MTSPQKDLDDFEKCIINNVREHGCQVNFIFDPAGKEPDFAYSIGFEETVNQPEVIIFGLERKLMISMVNDLLNQCRTGLVLGDWTQLEGLLEGHFCIAREVKHPEMFSEYLTSAAWYHRYTTGGQLQRAMQIVWPGAQQSLFPWELGCDLFVVEQQPALYLQETL